MKEFFRNLLIALVAIVIAVAIIVWVVLFGIFVGIPIIVMIIFNYENRNNLFGWYKNTIILPYKILGICNDWDEYISWVRFNI